MLQNYQDWLASTKQIDTPSTKKSYEIYVDTFILWSY